tara:strand:+ start:17 stop:976 length:960 start_codon:yes stop_codon:yes gene_type:complete
MSKNSIRELVAVVEVMHAFFQELYDAPKKSVAVSGRIYQGDLTVAERAIDLAVTIAPSANNPQTAVMGNWLSAGTTNPQSSAAQKERKQIHPDTVYAALCVLMKKGKIRDGGLGYYQVRTKINSMVTGQHLSSASHNPTYVLPLGTTNFTKKKKWLCTNYEGSSWYGNNVIKGKVEEANFSLIDSDWYKASRKKNISKILPWLASGIVPPHIQYKIAMIESEPIDWKWIPSVFEAFAAIEDQPAIPYVVAAFGSSEPYDPVTHPSNIDIGEDAQLQLLKEKEALQPEWKKNKAKLNECMKKGIGAFECFNPEEYAAFNE